MSKKNRVMSFILALVLVFTNMLSGNIQVYADGNGRGGREVTISGGGSGNWGRAIAGGGYLVSVVAYDRDKDSQKSADAISAAALTNAYKDSILIYNNSSREFIDSGTTVLIDLGIKNGKADNQENGGKLLKKDGSIVSENTSAYAVTAVDASTDKAKNLLGFKTNFGVDGNFEYDTTEFHNRWGKNGSKSLQDATNRQEFWNAVKAIEGDNCSLGGIKESQFVNISAGENKVYCILIVPVALFVQGESVSASIASVFPADAVADKVTLISKLQFPWGSYTNIQGALNTIWGYNLKEDTKLFNGYVPYGAEVETVKTDVASNIAAYIDMTNMSTSLADVKYTIVGSNSKPEENATSLSGVKYLLGTSYTNRTCNPVDKTFKELTGVSDVADYEYVENDSGYFTVKSNEFDLYGSDNSLNSVMNSIKDGYSISYTGSLVGGAVSAGKKYSLKTTYGTTNSTLFAGAVKKQLTSKSAYSNGINITKLEVTNPKKQADISASYLRSALSKAVTYNNDIKSTSSKDSLKASGDESNNNKPSIGVSVQLYKKATKVKSHLKVYDVTIDSADNFNSTSEAGKINSSEYDLMGDTELDYTSAVPFFEDTDDITLENVYYFLVPNDSTYGYDNNYSPNIQSSSYDDWSVVLGNDDEAVGTTKTEEILPKVGVTTDIKGYTVYVIRILKDMSLIPELEVKSELNLQDYELSHVFQSIYSGDEVNTTGNASKVVNGTLSHEYTEDSRTKTHTYTTYANDFRKYVWRNLEKESGTKSVVSKDAELSNIKLISDKYLTPMLAPYDTTTLALGANQNVNNNITLTRDIGDGDNLVASSISMQANSEVDTFLSDVLGVSSGNKPADTPVGTTVRDSNYVIGSATDLFKYTSGWVSTWRTDDYAFNYKVKNTICNKGYTHYSSKLKKGHDLPLYVNDNKGLVANVHVKENVHKYVTDTIASGSNTVSNIASKLKTSANNQTSTGVLNSSASIPTIVKHTNMLNNYFGEVDYLAQIPNTGDGNTLAGITQYAVHMMSEKARQTQSSSLYFITADSNGNAFNSDSAKLYSDNSTSNSAGAGGSLPVLYGGANISLALNTNINLKAYGYSLDLINPNDVPVGYSNYNQVVADNSNLLEAWGNNSHKADLLSSFDSYANTVFDTVSVDISLIREDGNEKYNNFNVSVGNSNRMGTSETGCYQIVVKNGVLDETNISYQELLKQLASDYYGDATQTAKANDLFKASGIYQSIVSSIESSTSTVNNSQSCDYLGNRTRWYDENVKTFVIRRYTNSATIENLALDDKLDYDMGYGSNGLNENLQSTYNKAKFSWYLTLYVDENNASNEFRQSVSSWFKPANGVASDFVGSQNIIVNSVYIPNVDFEVASATTAN